MNITRRAALALMAAPLAARAQTGGDLPIGALLSLTGEWSTLGQTSKVLLETAAGEINAWLAELGAETRVRLLVEDTRLDPDACVASARTLAASGAKLMIGPQSSAEAGALRPFLDSAGVLAVSQGSTASSLSLPGDNLYRFVPDDALEAQAVTALATARGTEVLVPCWRADAGNQGLAASVRRLFRGKVAAGIEYSANGVDFPAVAAALGAEVAGAGGNAAVYLAAFDEVVGLFRAAQAVPALAAVPWYGSDGVALSAALLADTQAARFAIKVGYPNPTLGRAETARAKWEPLVAVVRRATGLEPDAFALAAYDACWCGVLARLLAGSDDLAGWKKHFDLAADTFYGASSWAHLNANGDRSYGDYDFWAIREKGGAPAWTRVAHYGENRLEVTA